jgi:cell filamentation protein
MLYKQAPFKQFNLETLKSIHRILFEDIYEWAGNLRKGEFLTKGSSIFCRGPYIVENADRIFTNLKNENNLKQLNKSKCAERMAYYMGEVNALHPFREGNGRTSREFFRQLALYAGYILDFSKVIKDDLLTADIEAFNGQYDKLISILNQTLSIP